MQQHQNQRERAAYLMVGSTMELKEYQLVVQVENPVDFSSLLHQVVISRDFIILKAGRSTLGC
jgi:hypothetical protein